jgi:autotransporter-associated beta strand protein
VKTDLGTLLLTGTSDFTGETRVAAGTLRYGTHNALGSGAVTIDGSVLDIGSFSDEVGAVTLLGGSITGTTGTLTGTSYEVHSGTVSAILGGAGVSLTKTGSGVVMLEADMTYTGATTVNSGALIVNGSVTSSAFFVEDGGRLEGEGNLGNLTVRQGGEVSAGDGIGSMQVVDLTLEKRRPSQLRLGRQRAWKRIRPVDREREHQPCRGSFAGARLCCEPRRHLLPDCE